MELSAKIAYNTAVQITSKIIAALLGLAAVAYITRYLGREGFGQYTTIITFLSFFAIMADLGLTLVTVQLISRPGADEDRILGNLLGLRLVSAVIFIGLAPLSVIFLPYDPLIKTGVAVTALAFFFIAMNQVLVGLFQKNLRMDKVSIAEVVSRAVLLLGVIAAVRLERGLLGVMAAMVLANAVSFFLHYLFSLNFARIRLRFDLETWRQIITKSWPLAVTIVFNLIYLKADTLLLSLVKRPSQIGIIAEVGIYGAAYKVIDVLITFPFMFSGLILPVLTARWAGGKPRDFKNTLQAAFNVMVIMAIPLAVGAQFTAEKIMVLVAGDEFTASGPVLRILILAALFIFLGNIFAHAIIAVDKQRRIIGAYIFTAVTAVIGYLLFIPRFSYFGAAWVTVYSEAAIAAASLFLVWKYTKFLPSPRLPAKALAAAAVMALSLYALNYWTVNLFISLLTAAAVYFISLYLLGGLSRKNIKFSE